MTKEEEMLITKNTTPEKKFCSCVWPKGTDHERH